jgi:hypothetical protein
VQRCNHRADPPSSTAPERHRLIFPDDLGNVPRRLRTRDFSFCLLVAEYTGAAVERTSFPGGSFTRWSPTPFTAHCYAIVSNRL